MRAGPRRAHLLRSPLRRYTSRLTDLSKLNSVLAHHIRLSKCDPRSDEVNIYLGEL